MRLAGITNNAMLMFTCRLIQYEVTYRVGADALGFKGNIRLYPTYVVGQCHR